MKSLQHLAVALLCAVGLCGLPASALAQAPTIESEWVTDITTSDAVLHARIDPNGLLTKYKLQIDTTGHFSFFQTDGCALHPPGIGCTLAIVEGEPLPEGLVEPPESTLYPQPGGVEVAAYAGVLQPNTTYHFRAIAANSAEFVYGADCTFATPPSAPAEGEDLPEVACDQGPSSGGEDLPDPMPISDPISTPTEEHVAPTALSLTPAVATRKRHRRKPHRRQARRAVHPAAVVPAK